MRGATLLHMLDKDSVVTRPYRAADRAQVLALAPRLTGGVAPWRNPASVLEAVRGWIADSIAQADEDGHALIVAEHRGHIVGFISLSQRTHFTGYTDGYIGELATAERVEGRGVGGLLLMREKSGRAPRASNDSP